MTASEKFDLAMQEELRYAEQEYACVKRGDFKGADSAHAMRWRLMDKAAQFAFEAQEANNG